MSLNRERLIEITFSLAETTFLNKKVTVGGQCFFDNEGRVVACMFKDIQDSIFPFLVVLHEIVPGEQEKSHSYSFEFSMTDCFVKSNFQKVVAFFEPVKIKEKLGDISANYMRIGMLYSVFECIRVSWQYLSLFADIILKVGDQL